MGALGPHPGPAPDHRPPLVTPAASYHPALAEGTAWGLPDWTAGYGAPAGAIAPSVIAPSAAAYAGGQPYLPTAGYQGGPMPHWAAPNPNCPGQESRQESSPVRAHSNWPHQSEQTANMSAASNCGTCQRTRGPASISAMLADISAAAAVLETAVTQGTSRPSADNQAPGPEPTAQAQTTQAQTTQPQATQAEASQALARPREAVEPSPPSQPPSSTQAVSLPSAPPAEAPLPAEWEHPPPIFGQARMCKPCGVMLTTFAQVRAYIP